MIKRAILKIVTKKGRRKTISTCFFSSSNTSFWGVLFLINYLKFQKIFQKCGTNFELCCYVLIIEILIVISRPIIRSTEMVNFIC